MSYEGTRNVYGLETIPFKGVAADAIPLGAPVYRNVEDGDITVVATDGTKLIGFTASAATAAGDIIDVIPCAPGQQFKLTFDGTYAAAKLGTYVEITVTSGVPVANLDESTNDILRLEEVVHNSATDGYIAWFSAATTANQCSVEVA